MAMKLYNSIGPNPRVVKMFIAEKGMDIPRVEVDLMAGDNRKEPHLSRNPAGQMPALELDDGTCIAEILPICEYLDEVQPNPPLIGTNAEERAVTRMWTRRIDLNICEPMANGFRYSTGLRLFENRMRVIPQAADDLKALAAEKLAWLDGLIAGRAFVVGDRFTLADILLFVFIEFGAQVGQPLDAANKNLTAWKARIGERASAAASA
jgi:glutathione S-transferase